MTEERDKGLWVASERLTDGSYGVGFSIDADRAWTLDRDQATQHALSMLEQVNYALYDAAVHAQLTKKVGRDQETVALVLRDLRAHRGPSAWPHSLTYLGGVNLRGRPFLTALWDGEPLFQLQPGPAREHAVAILEVITTARLDNDFKATLVTSIGIEPWRAEAVVDDLASWRER